MVGPTAVACLILLLNQVVACDKQVDDSGPEEPQPSPRDNDDKTTQALLRKILQYTRPSPAPREPGEDEDDPIYLRLRFSTEYQRLLDSPDYRRLRTNPDFQRLLNNPDFVRLREDLAQRAVEEGSGHASRVGSIADYIDTNTDSSIYALVQIFRPRENVDLLQQVSRLGLGPWGTVQREESEGARRLSALLEAPREKSLLAELLHVLERPHHSHDHGHHEPSPIYTPIIHEAQNSVSVVCDHHKEAVPDHQHVAVEVDAPAPQNNTAEATDSQNVTAEAQEDDSAQAPAVKIHEDEVLGKINVIELIHYLADRVAREDKSGSHVTESDVKEKKHETVLPKGRVLGVNAGRRFLDPVSGSEPSRRPAEPGEAFFKD